MFQVEEDMNSGPSIQFFVMSDKEKSQIEKELKKIKKNDEYNQKVSEIEVFYKNGIWYDTISNLNALIEQDPENNDLLEFKNKLYESVNKASND